MERWDLYREQLVIHNNSKQGRKILARVLKINPKNILIQYENGERWNTSPSLLEPAPAGSEFHIDEAEGLELGNPVRIINGRFAGPTEYCIIGKSGMLYKLAKIRGSGDTYLHRVSASSLAYIPDGELHV